MIQYYTTVDWDSSLIDLEYTDADNSVVPELCTNAIKITSGAPAATAGKFIPGARIQNAVTGVNYQNTGTTASPVWSVVESSAGQPLNSIAYNSDATAGPLVILAAKLVNAILDRDGGATNRSDTTDTATALLAAVPGASIGTEIVFYYRNISTTSGQLLTLIGGAGVTLSGNVNVVAGQSQVFVGRFTNVTVPAITLYAMSELAGSLAQTFTASTVNTLRLITGATGNGPAMTAVGSDTNIPATLAGKGTGAVKLGQATSEGVDLLADQPLRDSSLNELLAFTKVASAVNEFTVRNAAAGSEPALMASGADTDIGIDLIPKGAGSVLVGGTGGLVNSGATLVAGFIPTVAASSALSGPGAIPLTSYQTRFTSTGTGDALTLADGTKIGQLKKISYVAEGAGGDTGVISGTGFTSATLNAIGDYIVFMWNGTAWLAIDYVGVTLV